MKTLIVGTGVIGTLYGWALAEVGVDMTHFVRPGKAAGLTGPVPMDVLDGRPGQHRPLVVAAQCLRGGLLGGLRQVPR